MVFLLPDILRAELPDAWLDGELWIGRDRFQATVGRVRRQGAAATDWAGIVFHVFDAPDLAQRQGGEGMMLRRPGSRYERRRSGALLKVKTFQAGDATVVGYTEGEGRHVGALGARVVEAAGRRFKLGTGLSDWDRGSPPPIGAAVVYRHHGHTGRGMLRLPTYAGMRGDNP